MSDADKTPRLIAWILLVFMVAVAIMAWLLDPIAKQSVFGLLVSAGFLAFSLLLYLYYKDTPKELSKGILGGGFFALAVLVLIAGLIFAGVGSGPTPNVTVNLIGGEVSNSVLGFGNTSTSLTSPGPTLTFNVGDVVKLTFTDSGQMPHNWALTTTNSSSASVLFNAQIASGDSPLQSGQSATVVFTVTQAGNFSYMCQVPGHVQLGMWGNVVVNP